MNLISETAKQSIDLCSLVLDMEPPERELLLHHLFSETRNSQSAIKTVREIYQLAAAGAWQPALVDLSTLVYAPLDNPALIPQIQRDVERILDCYPTHRVLRAGWNYVQRFSPNTKREL